MNDTRPMKKETRVTRCAKCNETFTYRFQTDYGQGENLIVKMSCPFCREKLHVDLSPYAKSKMVSYRSSDENPVNKEPVILDLPPELPTCIRE
ncbi:MAG: hypothetical protein GY737_19955 [Desulfobacteraceae bacterium]|nr:hypothetical protein [Desulfobacteraceae bacterium]